MTDDLIPEFIDDDALDEPPVPFKVVYARDGEKVSENFTARPSSEVPYAWLLDYFAAGAGDSTSQAAATLMFFDRVLLDDDGPEGKHAGSSHARFDQLIHDPKIAIKGKTLRQVQIYLLELYERPDPTRARSAGPKRSRSGRSRTSTGSTATRSARATT